MPPVRDCRESLWDRLTGITSDKQSCTPCLSCAIVTTGTVAIAGLPISIRAVSETDGLCRWQHRCRRREQTSCASRTCPMCWPCAACCPAASSSTPSPPAPRWSKASWTQPVRSPTYQSPAALTFCRLAQAIMWQEIIVEVAHIRQVFSAVLHKAAGSCGSCSQPQTAGC